MNEIVLVWEVRDHEFDAKFSKQNSQLHGQQNSSFSSGWLYDDIPPSKMNVALGIIERIITRLWVSLYIYKYKNILIQVV